MKEREDAESEQGDVRPSSVADEKRADPQPAASDFHPISIKGEAAFGGYLT